MIQQNNSRVRIQYTLAYTNSQYKRGYVRIIISLCFFYQFDTDPPLCLSYFHGGCHCSSVSELRGEWVIYGYSYFTVLCVFFLHRKDVEMWWLAVRRIKKTTKICFKRIFMVSFRFRWREVILLCSMSLKDIHFVWSFVPSSILARGPHNSPLVW